ncbi:sensor histidine kinase [Saccharothrix obliqua]|uniref:sensor histidine kinase n=1 Tax=Saccharothrix obliqua TaxID=2861747 RepID=UPI001C5E7553|nr:nitrate- and nitrite sensing domain-containing protein [Saccharothrix obliqua]MBW4720919.1 nitrate- and nitrite sensing domain-containing protein [Saccharothrix obliqua]
MTGDNSARRLRWGAVADWRNWRLPVKLAAVLAVPVLVAVGAGMVQIRGYVRAADGYSAMQRMVTLRTGLDPLLAGVQAERALSARRAENAPADQRRFKELVRITDTAAAGVRNLMERAGPSLGEVATARFHDAVAQLDSLPGLRERVLTGGIDLAGGIGGYSAVLRALLDFDQAMVGDFGDAALSGTATALHNLAMAGEQMSWQHATVLAGAGRGGLSDAERTALEESWTRQQDKLADFSAVATPRQQDAYRTALSGADVDARHAMLQRVRNDPDAVGGVAADTWDGHATATAKRLDGVLRGLEDQLKETSSRLQDETSDRAGLASVILAASMFAAVAVGFVVGSYLLRSLRALRVAALDVAGNRLPTLVARLRTDTAPDTDIAPVPVHTREEFGELARAFDAVHRQAVTSAAEEAELRTAMRNAFINLSRRSQGLVERQLRLMEELERRQDDPEQLEGLFKLDNLATRMRRNNENLMVLSGSDVARRFTRPVPLGDVLRAAASEVEQYQRIVIQPTPAVEVVGYAAGDLVRLVAELMDNATAFSPPSTQVVVGGRARPGGGVLLDVVDVGVGMSEEDLAEANAKIARAAADDSAELPVSRRLGLFVVGRLAGRHGVQVALREQVEGLRAVVAVPVELVRPVKAPATPPTPVSSAAAASADSWAAFRGRTTEPAPTGPTAFGTTTPTPPRPTPPPAARPAATTPTPPAATPPAAPTPVPTPVPTAPSRTPGAFFTKPAPRSPAPASAPGAPRPTSAWFGSAPVPAGSEPPRAHDVGGNGHVSVPDQGGAVREEAAVGNDSGLPKRRPRSNLAADRPSAERAGHVRRDPNATRGFLASYQTGVRQGVRESGENRTGRESGT